MIQVSRRTTKSQITEGNIFTNINIIMLKIQRSTIKPRFLKLSTQLMILFANLIWQGCFILSKNIILVLSTFINKLLTKK